MAFPARLNKSGKFSFLSTEKFSVYNSFEQTQILQAVLTMPGVGLFFDMDSDRQYAAAVFRTEIFHKKNYFLVLYRASDLLILRSKQLSEAPVNMVMNSEWICVFFSEKVLVLDHSFNQFAQFSIRLPVLQSFLFISLFYLSQIHRQRLPSNLQKYFDNGLFSRPQRDVQV